MQVFFNIGDLVTPWASGIYSPKCLGVITEVIAGRKGDGDRYYDVKWSHKQTLERWGESELALISPSGPRKGK